MAFRYYRCVQQAEWQPHGKLEINSKIARKVRGLCASNKDRKIVFTSNHSKSLAHLFRADRTNCGDWWSAPFNYFTFPTHDNVVDINDYEPSIKYNGTAIIGGGGLIGPAFPQLESLLESGHSRCIGWGLGDNMLDNKKHGYVASHGVLPEYINKFRLLGLRDVVEGIRWVPCASCMHPIFSNSFDIQHDIVVFEHKRVPLRIENFPVMSNNVRDINEIVEFISSGETVITNSYHGAYWATLLGRKCVCVPFSSKFYRMKFPPTLCHSTDWKSAIIKAASYPEALYDCRRANVSFYGDVMEELMQ